jgi:cell division initiation protein
MKVTGLEIRQHQFPLRLRGYDSTAVEIFLDRVAGRLEELVKENAQLWEALAKKDQEIHSVRAQEKDWKQALLTVQQARDDLIARGQQEAQSLVAEAQSQVHQLLAEAERRCQTITQDVQLLVHQKRQLIDGLRNLLNQHLVLLHVQEGQDARRQPSEISGAGVTMPAPPQTVGHVEGMLAYPEDLVHTGAEENTWRRQAAYVVEEVRR